ncbi:MAG: hypothetical protein ABIT38_22545 [Gemmatimonadaceae bacterium]
MVRWCDVISSKRVAPLAMADPAQVVSTTQGGGMTGGRAMHRVRRLQLVSATALAVVILTSSAACSKMATGDDARGRGHANASLSDTQVARAYAAALRSAFDIGPDLHLLVEPSYLSRSSGYGSGTAVPSSLLAELARLRIVGGTCTPQRESEGRAPTCSASRPGYITRFSELFRLGGDTVEVYVQSEVYAPRGGAGQQPFSFETAYQLMPRGDAWRVVREGRVRQSAGSK